MATFALAASSSAPAQTAPAQPISSADRIAVVHELGAQLQARYVFPELGKSLAADLATKAAHGGYDSATDTTAFAMALSNDLSDLAKDRHFRVMFLPAFKPQPDDDGTPPSAAEMAEQRKEALDEAFGINRVQRLPGNIGYLDVRGFETADFVGPAYASAITLLSGTDALIIDLRQNGGGDPSAVALLLSHFFGEGDERHLNSIYYRAHDSTREYWTNPATTPRYTRPVYVLVSDHTFSGGEEAAYDFQTQKRATLVGETTGGGANPGEPVSIGHGFAVFIPNGRAINPITKTNWDQVGVKPDVVVPAADALRTAYAAALADLLAKETDDERRERLKRAQALLDKGQVELPPYVPQPRR